MKKVFIPLLLFVAVAVHADIFTSVLSGDYSPSTLTAAEQDSILNSDIEQTQRYSLEYDNSDKLFRRSFVADWYIVDNERQTRKPLGAGLQLGKVRDAVISPNGRYIAFAKGNNLYIHKLDFGTEIAVTNDKNPDIINGIADWLYEEEFGITTLFAWSPDSKQLAFVRLDETDVPAFAWQTFLGGEPADTTLPLAYPQYPLADTLRYPKAGCANAKASVCVYDIATKAIQTMQVNKDNDDIYFPRLHWTSNTALQVLKLNRDQTKMEVLSCNPRSTVAHPLYKEESKNYFVDYNLFDQWQWLTDGSFIVLSEREGWRRAYLHNAQGIQTKVLTPDGIDVTALYAVDEKSQTLYYQAAPTPATRQIYAVSIKAATPNQAAKPVQLTTEDGTHAARFSADAKWMIDCYQSFQTPNIYTLYSVSKQKIKKESILLDNTELAAQWNANQLNEPQLVTIPNNHGQMLEAMLIQPAQLDPTKQYPLVVMHYSGPQSQRVLNRWRKRFEYVLSAQGYMVLIVDSRGGDCRGRAWRNETYMNLGIKESQDLIAAANWAATQPNIDGQRMAIMGWSYGGYQTLMTMSNNNHPYKAGIAIAPVTDWKLYDSAYTERYMRRPQVNDGGYQNASLIKYADQLTGEVLIIHGTADDNVHAQHVMHYFDALVRANKQFEMQLYTDDNHHMRYGNNNAHMHTRILNFLKNKL